MEVAAPDRRLRPPPGVVVRRRRYPDDAVAEVDGLRSTTPLRTAYDLATRLDLVPAVVAADGLARVGRFTGTDLVALARSLPGHRGNRRVPAVGEQVDPGAESPPETRMRLAMIHAGLPRPITQYRVLGEDGWEVGRVDLAWPEFKIALEYDGRDHAFDDRRGRDIDRIENLRLEGWLVIVVTSRQMRQPGRIAARVREEMRARRVR